MSRSLVSLSTFATLLGGTAIADVPVVAVDIAPVHSLVARVMEGVGTPELIIPPEASVHEYNLRPSEAAAIQDAQIVFWMGEGLTPWLEDSIETLASGAAVTALLEAGETPLLEFREGALFEAHDHDSHDGDHDDEHAAKDDHDDHGHDDHGHGEEHAGEKAHDDHEHGHEKEEAHAHDDDHDDHGHEDHADEHGHDHGAYDPHAWLSPAIAGAWLPLIADTLSGADPANAEVYAANAAAGQAELETLASEVNDILAPGRDKQFIVFHDAYQYFETAFAFPASGAISIGDASDPSPARIAEIQDRIREQGVDCVLAEPQFNAGLVETVLDGTEAKTGVVDPLGSDLTPGISLYSDLIRNMAKSLADCL